MDSESQQRVSPATINAIGSDFYNRRTPFDEFQAPERDALESISPLEVETELRFLTFSAALDYQRDADLHWQEMAHLFEDHRPLFIPTEAPHIDRNSLFEDHRIRFPNRDANTWGTIAETLHTEYDGRVTNLIEAYDHGAGEIYNRIRDGGFPFLGGDKIAPFWIRLVHEHAVELENLESIPIAVDGQVRRVTEAIDRTIEDDDTIREFWVQCCEGADYAPLEIDEPLWLIGRNFDDWGRDYLLPCEGETL